VLAAEDDTSALFAEDDTSALLAEDDADGLLPHPATTMIAAITATQGKNFFIFQTSLIKKYYLWKTSI
jgi:hypothetical protein